MSFLRFEDEKVDCFCFNEHAPISNSGLKPVSNIRKKQELNNKERQAYSSDMKRGGKSQIGKTSLKRGKNATPEESKIYQRPILQPPYRRQEEYFEKHAHISGPNIPAPISHRQEALNIEMPAKMQKHQQIRFEKQYKPVNEVRNFYNRYNNTQIQKINFIPQPPQLHIQLPTKKTLPSSSKISLNNLQKIEEMPLHQISYLKDRSSHKFLTPRKQTQSPQQTSRQTQRNQRPCSGNKNRGSLTPREAPQNRLHLKEIQSVFDENENLDQEISQVIGRGWQDRQEDFSPACRDKLKTQTLGTSASHIKNSEIANSVFGVSQSLMRWA